MKGRFAMHVRCKTSFDEWQREQWPTLFVCKPCVGEQVRNQSGITAKIQSITYFQERDGTPQMEIWITSLDGKVPTYKG